MVTAPLQRHLRRVGRRLLAVGVATGLGWGLVAAVGVVLAAAWFDLVWELPPGLRLAALFGAAAAGVALVAAAGWLARRRLEPRALAHRLDRVATAHGEIRSGVDLWLEQRPFSPLTHGLAALAVDRAGRLAEAVPGRRAVPTKPLGWSFGTLIGLAAAVALVAVVAPRLAQTQWLRFTDPYGDHPPYSRVIYRVEPGDVQVVYGSGLDIRVTTEGPPVERLHLILEGAGGEEALPMFPEPGGGWRASVANVTAPGRYFVRAHAGRSQRFRLDVLTVPKLEAVRFRITPPAYTNRPPVEGPLPAGGLAGLPGTKVDVFAKSNRPLAGGQLDVPGATLPLTPTAADGPEVAGSFEIRQAGPLSLKVVDVDGQPSREPFTAPITVLTDERPFVRLLEPPPQSFATPDAALPVVIAAEDDYGISRVELYRSLNDSRPLPLEVPVPKPAPTRWQERVILPLGSYGLQPGDEIKLFARVEDNDPAGPKGAESTVAVVRIISQADLDKLLRARQGLEMLQSKYQQAVRRLEGLADQVEELKKKGDQAKAEDLKKLAEKMRQEAEALRQAAATPMDYDIDRHLSNRLQELANQVQQAADEAEALSRQPGLTPQQVAAALEGLKKQLQQQRQQAEQEMTQPLEHLAQVMPLLADAARFTALAQRQRDLAERLKSLPNKDRPDDPSAKARMRDLQAEQQQLREELARLLEDVEDHLAKLPESPELEQLRTSAQEFVEGVRGSGAAEAMGEAESALAEFSGSRGSAAAGQAADILERFLSKGEGMAGRGRMCLKFSPGLSAGLGSTVEQLLADMGLLPGMDGDGSGGYSTRRNSLENVGLYGRLPTMESASGGSRRNQQSAASATRAGVIEPGRLIPGTANPSARAASGSAEALVPVPYRRRVAEYFQRIADEAGKK